MSTAARDFPKDSQEYRREAPLTGEESRVTEVKDVAFPKLLDPVDDTPPATIITYPPRGIATKRDGNRLIVRGTTTDNTRTKRVIVNGVEAHDVDYNFHQWEAVLENVLPGEVTIVAHAEDVAGNVERHAHRLTVSVE